MEGDNTEEVPASIQYAAARSILYLAIENGEELADIQASVQELRQLLGDAPPSSKLYVPLIVNAITE